MKNGILKNSVLVFLGSTFILASCKDKIPASPSETVLWKPFNDSIQVAANRGHELPRMRYKLVQSKVLDKNDLFLPLFGEVGKLTQKEYKRLSPLILEQDIPTIQQHIREGKLDYETLVLFYLYRIYRYELGHTTTLNTILALNKNVVHQARALDREYQKNPHKVRHPIYGMPILLKDNINTQGMNTTAGAIALMDNKTDDSFITTRLKHHGALILGKANLSEWAYFLCDGCPVGYSAVGGQTLNPYGRGLFETGGSSSGSGTGVAANYAVAAVGTETSGSILSPSSQNSIVGLKPTVGLLGRSGIVPISSTLDTPGPMTKNVVDNVILLSAMLGKDSMDEKSVAVDKEYNPAILENASLKGKRLGVFSNLMEDNELYRENVERLRELGATIVQFDSPGITLDRFLSILNIDMKNDLPKYLDTYVKNRDAIKITSVGDAIKFNQLDSLVRIPYGQAIFEGIIADTTTQEELEAIKKNLEQKGREFFDAVLDSHQLHAVLSINNYHAGFAAVAKYPALTVPMGYKESGEPMGLTFIGKPFREEVLLELGHAYERATGHRRIPLDYQE